MDHIPAFLSKPLSTFVRWLRMKWPSITADSLSSMSVIMLHMATVPGLLALMFAWTDDTPQLELVLMLWAGLITMFVQAMVTNNRMLIALISLGFMFQSVLMALIFFR